MRDTVEIVAGSLNSTAGTVTSTVRFPSSSIIVGVHIVGRLTAAAGSSTASIAVHMVAGGAWTFNGNVPFLASIMLGCADALFDQAVIYVPCYQPVSDFAYITAGIATNGTLVSMVAIHWIRGRAK